MLNLKILADLISSAVEAPKDEFGLYQIKKFPRKPIDYARSQDFPIIQDLTREQPLYTPKSYESIGVIDMPLNVKSTKIRIVNPVRVREFGGIVRLF